MPLRNERSDFSVRQNFQCGDWRAWGTRGKILSAGRPHSTMRVHHRKFFWPATRAHSNASIPYNKISGQMKGLEVNLWAGFRPDLPKVWAIRHRNMAK